MKEYSNVEIDMAKNLITKGYEWLARDHSDALYAFMGKPCKGQTAWLDMHMSYIRVCQSYIPLFKDIKWEDKDPTRLDDIVSPLILEEVERHYLEAVLKPLPKVESIERASIFGENFIRVYFAGNCCMEFPPFKADTMYKGMMVDRLYTPKELGLRGLKCD